MNHDDHDEPFSDDDETDLPYDDGFAEAFYLGEADAISGSKRREKARRDAQRKDTGRIVASATRHIDRHSRRYRAQNDAARLARMRWEKRFKPLIVRHWAPGIFGPLDAVILMTMQQAVVRRAVALVTEKLGDANDVEDAILINARALIASGVAAAARRSGRITEKQQEAFTRAVYDGLDATEKVIRIVVKASGSGESEAMPDPIDELEAIASVDEDDFAWEDFPNGEQKRSRRSGGEQAYDPRLAAQFLRQGAKYLLRMERRLVEGRR